MAQGFAGTPEVPPRYSGLRVPGFTELLTALRESAPRMVGGGGLRSLLSKGGAPRAAAVFE